MTGSLKEAESAELLLTSMQYWQKTVREAPPPKKTCIFGHCPNCDLTPPIAQIRALCGTIFFAENEKILKTAILTLGMNILTETKVKDDSKMVF